MELGFSREIFFLGRIGTYLFRYTATVYVYAEQILHRSSEGYWKNMVGMLDAGRDFF